MTRFTSSIPGPQDSRYVQYLTCVKLEFSVAFAFKASWLHCLFRCIVVVASLGSISRSRMVVEEETILLSHIRWKGSTSCRSAGYFADESSASSIHTTIPLAWCMFTMKVLVDIRREMVRSPFQDIISASSLENMRLRLDMLLYCTKNRHA